MLYTVKTLQYNISADKLHIFDELDTFIKSWKKNLSQLTEENIGNLKYLITTKEILI